MLITDFFQIENEEDRAIYVKCRQILDAWFLFSQQEHKKKNHMLYQCFNRELDEGRDEAKKQIIKHKLTIDELKHMRFEAEQDVLTNLQGIIVLDELIEVKH